MTRRSWLFAVLVVPFWLAGAAAHGASGVSTSSDPPSDVPYRIGPQDLLDIAVWNNKAVSEVVPVRPDGKISLPLLNDVQASGLTPDELRNNITTKLRAYISDPDVSVIVREVHSFKVSVLGQVKTPGRYEFQSPSTVLDAIARAGGLTAFASRNRIIVLRRQDGGLSRIPFRYDDAVSRGGSQQNYFVQPDDIVIVP
jgi:polysaccharide biosynthesis/export protein